MGHQVIKLQNPLKTLGFLQFYRFKTVKDRIIPCSIDAMQEYFFQFFACGAGSFQFRSLCFTDILM